MSWNGPPRRPKTPPPAAEPPAPDPQAERVRPADPFLRFFQDCLISSRREPTGDGEYVAESFLDRKADEFGVPKSEIRTVRRVARFVARTPVALVEVRRPVGTDPDDGAVLEGVHAFTVPAYGEYLDVVREALEAEGYETVHTSDGEVGERAGVVLEHPETGVVVGVRTYDHEPMAQGPVGFREWVQIYADAIAGMAEPDGE